MLPKKLDKTKKIWVGLGGPISVSDTDCLGQNNDKFNFDFLRHALYSLQLNNIPVI